MDKRRKSSIRAKDFLIVFTKRRLSVAQFYFLSMNHSNSTIKQCSGHLVDFTHLIFFNITVQQIIPIYICHLISNKTMTIPRRIFSKAIIMKCV